MPVDNWGRRFLRDDDPGFNQPPRNPADPIWAWTWDDPPVPPAQPQVAVPPEAPPIAQVGLNAAEWRWADPVEVPANAQVNAEEALAAMVARAPRPRRRREEGDLPDNEGYCKKYQQLDLAKLPVGDYIRKLAPFKIEYDSHEQINTKLNNTVIFIKGHPMLVAATFVKDGGFGLLVKQNGERSYRWVDYKDVEDLRPAEPGYVNFNGACYWTYRVPERQNQQGMNGRNTWMKEAGRGTDSAMGMHTETMLTAFASKKNLQYQNNLPDMMASGLFRSVKLSNNVALHPIKNKGCSVGVEYIGRPIGLLINHRVKVLDEADLNPTWIHKEFHDVNLELTP